VYLLAVSFPNFKDNSICFRLLGLTLPFFAIPTQVLVRLTSPVFPDKKYFYHTFRSKVKNFLKKVEVEAKVEEEVPPGKITKYKLQITKKDAPFGLV
jgi:hypothetical protein